MQLTYQPTYFIIRKWSPPVSQTKGDRHSDTIPTLWEAIPIIPIQQVDATPVHPLARFVTKEAIALLLKIEVDQIKDVRCWPNVILVVGERVSRFVSYADLPPILGVEPPRERDFGSWRKRWKKKEKNQAPKFWVEFYKQKFCQAFSVAELYAWGQMVRVIKLALSQAALQELRRVYFDVKCSLASLTKIAA